MEGPSAVVDADDVRRMVAAYADPVHDAVVRAGCPASEAAEVLAEAAGHLLDALIRTPAGVRDLLGCWLRQAELLARERCSGVSVRRDDAAALRVRAVLAELAESDRRALLFRDAYDLPPCSAAVALGVDLAGLPEQLASARLDFLRRYDAAVPLAGPATCGTHPGELAALSDRTLPPVRASALRRHTYGCLHCEYVADAQERARRIIAALPLAIPDPATRAALVTRTGTLAERRLSVLDAMLASLPDAGAETPRRPLVSPGVVAVAIAAALLAGVGAGLSNLTPPFLDPDRPAASQPAPTQRAGLLPPAGGVPRPVATPVRRSGGR